LRGDFSFDAISPDGDSLYLIQYTSAKDPSRYAVRAYDLAADRLLAAPVVDPRERGEAMRGSPITRYTSRDGRWAYTLYDGAGTEPFVHALDTVDRQARCIDLPMLEGRRDLYTLRLTGGGSGGLRVVKHDRTLALVDTRTFRATVPAPPAPATSGVPWLLVGGSSAAALLLAGLLAFALRRRRRSALVAPSAG
jgi:MprA protease rhombosortase-interaction domain-containing protein